jgi:hypothetical protein
MEYRFSLLYIAMVTKVLSVTECFRFVELLSVFTRKKAPLQANYSIANYLKTDSKAMVTRILDTLIENAVNHSKIVATEIIDDILKGAVKTDNNSMKRKHSVPDKTFVTIPLCRVTAENMSPHTTYFNTLGSSRYAFCALQIWNTVFLYLT